MSLNLCKHGAEMQTAWKAVCDANDPTDWALYGYEGPTFDLKLVSTGEDGIEEMIDDLNANKILYAFIKVVDPKTSLPKYVFLHWQGESALAARKGKAATHVRDIQKYFHGHHITVNARSDDEVCVEDILAKVSKASASKFNFNEKPTTMESAPDPVGTAHQRIIPQKELPNMDEREKFWNEEESKEKERIDVEKTRKVSEYKQMDSERRSREEKETKARDTLVKEREKKISQIRDCEQKVTSNDAEKLAWERQQELDHKEEVDRQNRGKVLQRKRSEEARQLISQRSTNEARSVFERNSSMGQMNFRKQSYSDSSSSQPNSEQEQHTFPPKPSSSKQSNVVKAAHEVYEPSKESSSDSHSYNAKIGSNAIHDNKNKQQEKVEPKTNPTVVEKLPSKRNKEVEEQANVANANEVSTEDIVVPPPESFGNDDNHRALAAAAAASQNHDHHQQLENNYQQQRHQEEAGLRSVAVNPAAIPPDVTHQTNDIKPDLIQDVTQNKEQPDLTKGQQQQHHPNARPPMGEPEKNHGKAGMNGNGNDAAASENGQQQGQHPEYGLCAMALYDYQAADDTEISFDPGQVITHIDQIDPGWWQGLSPDGNYGLFPANYVEMIDPKELARAEELTAH